MDLATGSGLALPAQCEALRWLTPNAVLYRYEGEADKDATHLGFAAAHGLDFLLTRNCRHLNNRALERRIERACLACGLTCPVICTPTELMNLEA